MKTAVIFFRDADMAFDGEYYQKAIDLFSCFGINIDCTLVLSCDDEKAFSDRIADFKTTYDNLVIVDGNNNSFSARKIIAEKMEASLEKNSEASTFLNAICKADGVLYDESYAMMPIGATVIPNLKGALQGFILEKNTFSVIYLPEEFAQLKITCNSYALPYLKDKSGERSKKLVLKYFGDVNKLKETLAKEKGENKDVIYKLTTRNGDVKVDLIFKNTNEEKEREFVRAVIEKHKENIYAEFDTTLGERLFDLLKLREVKLSVAESFTSGRVVAEVLKNSGASQFVDEGVVTYSNESKMKRLGVARADLVKKGAVSSVVAYEMAVGLLNGGECDLAIATTGIAGPNSDGTDKPVGLCFIAVGMKDGVHTYRYNLKGDREEITETAKNTALFLAIKKLKSL